MFEKTGVSNSEILYLRKRPKSVSNLYFHSTRGMDDRVGGYSLNMHQLSHFFSQKHHLQKQQKSVHNLYIDSTGGGEKFLDLSPPPVTAAKNF